MPGRSVTLAKDVDRLERRIRSQMHSEDPGRYPDPMKISHNAVFRWMCDRLT
ncbi:hypothetical protein [Methanorbis furvi]|uniref:Uncharacterized protein n=1 Tax=Methanorbis furvi TaxID=3028299 RepID=A0AAE4MEQ3_9EURY|nr:hypothetical protein [Methanocorpusculaceae archaeon Ag1]